MKYVREIFFKIWSALHGSELATCSAILNTSPGNVKKMNEVMEKYMDEGMNKEMEKRGMNEGIGEGRNKGRNNGMEKRKKIEGIK